ncbi:MAG: ATP-binding protein, partial [Acidimicrobiia bacterium]
LDLARLVGLIAEPPFRKLGVFELDEFYPPEERTELAMKLNGLLASPSFAAWLEGEPLDIERLLTGSDRTRAPIVYLAHLSESERQFVVTLLLAKLVTWMRRQSGTGKLRALIYMDEVFGFCPPVAEPPSKKQILTILKQARAYGVGMVVSTQNPVDLDYKAMSNAGTWMVGRLQTENDKKRILEGLADAGGATDVDSVDTLISNLEKRQFVLRQAGSAQPSLFGTRWAMSYLAGPLDRTRVEALTPRREEGGRKSEADESKVPEPPSADSVPLAPEPASSVNVGHLDPAAAWASEVGAVPGGKRWKAIGVATVHLLYDERGADVNHTEDYEAVMDPLESRFHPETVKAVDHDSRDFRDGAPGEGEFILVDAPIDEASYWSSLSTDLRDHLMRERRITIWKNPALKIFSRVGETDKDFKTRCAATAEEGADADVAKLTDRYATKIDRVRDQISKADRRVAELGTDLSVRRQHEVLSGVGDILGSLLGGRSKSGALSRASSRRSQSRRTQADLDAAVGKLAEEQLDLAELESELADELSEITAAWDAKVQDITPVEIPLESSDVDVAAIRLIWVPTGRD